MMGYQKYRNKILNFIPPSEDLAVGMEAAYQEIVARDASNRTEHDFQGKPYKSYIRKSFDSVFWGNREGG